MPYSQRLNRIGIWTLYPLGTAHSESWISCEKQSIGIVCKGLFPLSTEVPEDVIIIPNDDVSHWAIRQVTSCSQVCNYPLLCAIIVPPVSPLCLPAHTSKHTIYWDDPKIPIDKSHIHKDIIVRRGESLHDTIQWCKDTFRNQRRYQ